MDLKGAKIRNFYTLTADMNIESSSSPKRIKIPHYQRPYKWGSENINKLIEDWNKEDSKKYFCGSIVTVDNKENETHELIDGQQRFTTIFLTNYVCFLVSRVALRQSVTETTGLINFTSILSSYIKSAKYLFLDDNDKIKALDDQQKQLIKDFSLTEDKKRFNETKDKLLDLIALPNLPQSDENYSDIYYEKMSELISSQELALTYDRSSFNDALSSSLKRCILTLSEDRKPELNIWKKEEIESDHEKGYIQAIETIFKKLSQLVDISIKQPFEIAQEIIAKAEKFLKEIALCVVQTGNANDAYTLFEVLNDRSLALDDLDLIKNQFYKNFVLKNKNNYTNLEIDNILHKLDNQWIENIFSNEPAQKRKLIAYLAIVFITGDEKIIYNRGDGNRHSIQAYLEKTVNYTKNNIETHFNIFQCCKLILDYAEVKFSAKDLTALRIECEEKSSVLKKTISLLMALNQEGVLSGLVNFTLKYLEKKEKDTVDFNPEIISQYLEAYMVLTSCPEEIKKQSMQVWQLSILSKNSEAPRDLSVELIRNNNLNTLSIDLRHIADKDKKIEDFTNWLNNWKYSSEKLKMLKIRLIFARLISLSFDGNKLEKKPIHTKIQHIEKLQLDHIEASKPDSNRLSEYFDDPDRDNFINGLGNMMPLPSKQNIQKSNQPMKDSFGYYEKAGIEKSHHLYQKTNELYIKYSSNKVPTTEFFNKRKEYLKELFIKAVNFE